MENFKSGETVGNNAAINVELGWIPDRVEVFNATDEDILTVGYPNRMVIPFSDGGDDAEIVVGEEIVGATSGAKATVKSILLYSGTWAAGDAAGFFVIERDTLTGTFQSEEVVGQDNGGDATVTANVTHGFKSTGGTNAVDSATGNDAITGYVGSDASNSKGFTIGSSVAEEAKLLRWAAWRNG